MAIHRLHPTASITALCFLAAVVTNFLTINRGGHVFIPLVASLILASPFAVLLFGHLTLARTWRRNVFLAGGNLLFAFCWALASFVMRWFQAGWIGLAFLGTALVLLAVGYIALACVIKEGSTKHGV